MSRRPDPPSTSGLGPGTLRVVESLGDLMNRPVWMDHAACRRVAINFFATKGQKLGPARAVCESCAVRSHCLEYGLDHDDAKGYGIWGGLSPRERQDLRRKSRLAQIRVRRGALDSA